LLRREQGKDKEAAALLRELLGRELAAQFPAPLIEWLSEHYFAEKHYAQAAAAAKQLIASHSQAAWQQAGWCLLGRAETALNHHDAARKAFAEALRQPAPTEYGAEAALRLADLEFAAKAYAEARSHYAQAISLAASEQTLGIRARAFAGVGQAAAAEGAHDEAARSFMMVAILYNDPALVPEALFGATKAFLATDSVDDARDAAAELQARYPESPWTAKAASLLPAPLPESTEEDQPQVPAAEGNMTDE
jgi:tetratricopeptide (TPR) repeat protein